MNYFDTYKNRITAIGGSVVGSQLENMKQTILSGFYNNPSYNQVYINDSSTPSDVWITDDSTTKEIKQILTKPGDTISTGDLVKWNNEHWMTLIVDDMQVYFRGSIQKCFSSIKWQDSSLSTIEAPFTIKSEASQLGIEEGRIISLPKERRNIIIQSNPDTQKIKRDQRFIFDGRVWRVTGLNGLVDNLIYLTLEEDAINSATDNLELRIADYIEPNYTLSILNGSSTSLNMGDTLQLNIEVLLNGVKVDNPQVTYESSDETIASVNAQGLLTALLEGSSIITVTLSNDTSIIATISVDVVEVVSDNYSLTITTNTAPVNELKQAQTKTYNAQISNNGQIVSSDSVVWGIYEDDQVTVATNVTLTVIDGLSCSVKCNAYSSGTRFKQLKATHNDSGVVAWYRIETKPLW